MVNYLILRARAVSRLKDQGFSETRARKAWFGLLVAFVPLAVAQFVVQMGSNTPHFPALALFPTLGPSAFLAFSILVVWYALTLAAMWFHRDGLLIASAACQGLLAPNDARAILTVGTILGLPAVILGVNAAA